MKIIKAHNLSCPVDGARFEYHEKQLVCSNGHVFDVARQGYVNLLPAQHKRSKQPGDSKAMVSARGRFLNSGPYEPVARQLADIAFAQITHAKQTCFMDAGCGEGYYLDYVLHELKDKKGHNELSFIGLDISRPAIAAAAKRSRQIRWIVGTNRQPPVEPASVDVVLCIFGFRSLEGFHKLLKSGGKVILVEPGPEHLQELREIIYSEVRKTDPPGLSALEETGFSIVDRQRLQFQTGALNNEQINDLLVMTPHFYRANKQGRETATKLQILDVCVDAVFTTLEKKPGLSDPA